ncbi:MAG: hypothetical protein KAS12_07175, partial [Candidatus Aenigmarchaeota archaeon]|nr:hypothetical protein [Candidatus Aenigmarchaeota archaeon]
MPDKIPLLTSSYSIHTSFLLYEIKSSIFAILSCKNGKIPVFLAKFQYFWQKYYTYILLIAIKSNIDPYKMFSYPAKMP